MNMCNPDNFARLRRNRSSDAVRSLVAETRLRPSDFVYPMFVTGGSGVKEPIGPMPGCDQLSVDEAVKSAATAHSLGIPAVLLFGLPSRKDEVGSSAWDPDEPVQRAVSEIRSALPELAVITDVCLCEYTSHGHCGLLDEHGGVDNDRTLPLLAKTAVSHARAGASVVAPSAMMDGQVAAIRTALDAEGFGSTGDTRLFGEVCVGLLWPVSHSGGLGAAVRGPARLPDGARKPPGGDGGNTGRHRRRRRHGDGQAGPRLPRRDRRGKA